MLPWDLKPALQNSEGRSLPRFHIAAVRYLNTLPLVWGMLHGGQRGLFHLDFVTPAECADLLEAGRADIGIVPVVEVPRLGLEVVPGACIASFGPVRSILLVSRRPWAEIRTLAADVGSRTSTVLARLILAQRFGVEPQLVPMAPDLPVMLAQADAALLIGDAALKVNPESYAGGVLDLGEEWTKWTGKPMVFAVWAARPGLTLDGIPEIFKASASYGADRIDEIVRREARRRGIAEDLARTYLTKHIRYRFGENEREGLGLFLDFARRTVAA